MADPRALVAGRYAFAGSLKNSQTVERWVGVDSGTGRRVVLLAVDAGRLTTLDSARGVKHRHLTGVIDVVREVDAASLPSGRALPPGFGVAVAEFVPGKTMHGELSQSRINPSKAVAWIMRLADAVQALHSAGAVHAALSPRSVIAVPEGRAIAPVLSQLVAPAIGPFCPPERLKGSAETAPDDVWALHATLYAALTREAVCEDGDFREVAKRLHQLARPLAAFPDAGPALAAETFHADAGAHGSGLDWYELPATAIIRKSCCDGATPITLPETTGWCEQLQTVVPRIADDSGKAGDLAPDARSFDKAVSCLFANKVPYTYAYEKPPSEANRAAFQQFLSRAAISEARR